MIVVNKSAFDIDTDIAKAKGIGASFFFVSYDWVAKNIAPIHN